MDGHNVEYQIAIGIGLLACLAAGLMGSACVLLKAQQLQAAHRSISLHCASMLAAAHLANAATIVASTILTRYFERKGRHVSAAWACTCGALGTALASWTVLFWTITYVFCVHMLLLGRFPSAELLARRAYMHAFAWGAPLALVTPLVVSLVSVADDNAVGQLAWSPHPPLCLDWNACGLLVHLRGPGEPQDWRLLTIIPVSLSLCYATVVLVSIVRRFRRAHADSVRLQPAEWARSGPGSWVGSAPETPAREALLAAAVVAVEEHTVHACRLSPCGVLPCAEQLGADELGHMLGGPSAGLRDECVCGRMAGGAPRTPPRSPRPLAASECERVAPQPPRQGRPGAEFAPFWAVERRLAEYYLIFLAGGSLILAHGLQDMEQPPASPALPLPRALYSCDALTTAVMGIGTALAFFHNPRNRPRFAGVAQAVGVRLQGCDSC